LTEKRKQNLGGRNFVSVIRNEDRLGGGGEKGGLHSEKGFGGGIKLDSREHL